MKNAEQMVGVGEADLFAYAMCEVCGVDSGCQYKVSGPRFQSSEDWVKDHSRCTQHPRPMSPTTVDISNIQEYGLTQKLSNSIRCF